MGNIVKSNNQLLKDTLLELTLIAAKVGISSIPLGAIAIDLMSGGLKLFKSA